MNQRTIILFLGPPGSGKGSLSQLCVKRLGWRQLSTGNLCREHIAQETELGKKIDFAIKSGRLISDSLIIGMVEDWLSRTEHNDQPVIFDGFPRTVPQAESLQKFLENRDDLALELIRLHIEDDELVSRLLMRTICQNDKCQTVYSLIGHSSLMPKKSDVCNECESPLMRRSDDEENAITERLRIYHEHENGLLSFFKASGHFVKTIKVSQPLEKVYESFLKSSGIEQG